jgi:hypothetical protein
MQSPLTKVDSPYLQKILAFTLGAVIFVYCLCKAVLLGITWDEAYTYFHFIRHELFIQAQVESMSANNHWLNNWLCIYLIKIFGFKILVLRIPALIGCLLQLVFSWKILKKFNAGLYTLAAFLLVNVHPYLLDFFTLSRGYGLSIGCMTTALYFVMRFIETKRTSDFYLCTLFSILAVLASFLMLPVSAFCIGTLVIISIATIYKKEENLSTTGLLFLKKYFFPIAIYAAIILYVVHYSFQLKEAEALYFGGHDGIIVNTFFSIYEFMLYEGRKLMAFSTIGSYLLLLIPIIAFSAGLFYLIKSKTTSAYPLIILSGSVLFCFIAILLQFWLLDNLLPMYRTALYLYVLIVFSWTACLLFLVNKSNIPKLILVLSAMVFVGHFVKKANTNYVLEWKKDSAVTAAIMDLKMEIENSPNEKKMSIGVGIELDVLFNFYRDYYNLQNLYTIHNRKNDHPLHDFYFGEKSELTAIEDRKFEKCYLNGSFELWKNLKKSNRSKSVYRDSISFRGSTKLAGNHSGAGFLNQNRTFSETFEISLDSLPKSKLRMIKFSGDFLAPQKYQCNTYLVISHEKNGKIIDYAASSLRDFIEESDQWIQMEHGFYLSPYYEPADYIKAYIYNPNGHELYYNNLKFEVLDFKEKSD